MSESEPGTSRKRPNPLIWVAIVVIGAILFIFLGGDREQTMIATQPDVSSAADDSAGAIDRSLLVPPGMRARQYIEQLRERGKPYPLDEAVARADRFLQEGSLADAHLLYFFAAREDHLPAIMVMAKMSDPTQFQAENSLLDNADVIQAYKWYRKAAGMGHAAAAERVAALQQWARNEAEAGNVQARQLLLNYE